jgi:protein involved in polysaccharide export with SLBB domain
MKRILFPLAALILLSGSLAFAASYPSITEDPSADAEVAPYVTPYAQSGGMNAPGTNRGTDQSFGATQDPSFDQNSDNFSQGQQFPSQQNQLQQSGSRQYTPEQQFQGQSLQGQQFQDQQYQDQQYQDQQFQGLRSQQDQPTLGQQAQPVQQGRGLQGGLGIQEQDDFLPMQEDEQQIPYDGSRLNPESLQQPGAMRQQLPKAQQDLMQYRRTGQPSTRTIRRTTKRSGEVQEMSPIERDLSANPVLAEKVKSQPYGAGKLVQYGYSFFRPELSGFQPQNDVPVGPDYLVSAGDRLTLTVWGGLEATVNLTVNRAGEVVLPKVGAIKVAGQRFDQLPALFTAAIGRVYKNFHLNVNMGRMGTIKVYVVGEVTSPGDYNVNSLSTVLSALSNAGGPTKNGSLRNIQINRGGKLIETVDLYDFFLKGDKGRDIRLQSGDTILVPVIGPVAAVAGNVRRPAIYELRGERQLKQLLELAGGINPSGYLQRVQLYRVDAHDKQVVTDFNLDLKGTKSIDEVAGTISIKDHDLVKVLPIDKVLRGYVRLSGHVLRPGDYALKPGLKLSGLLNADDLLPEYYAGAGQIIRLVPPDQHPEVIHFDLGRAMKGEPGYDLELKEFDRVKVFASKEMEETPFVRVNGEVQRPGQKRYFKNMTVRDLLLQGGNTKRDAFLKSAEITRLKQVGDTVTSYAIQVDLEKAIAGGSDNLKLEPFDELSVRRIPDWAESTERYVQLRGEFVFPGIYPIHKGERLSSVIERAGGFTDRAYLKGVKFTREGARRLQQQRMDEALAKAQEDIITLQTKTSQTASSAEEVAAAKSALEGLMQSVEVLKTKKAEGRVLVEIASLNELKGSVYDVELQGGDRLQVPSDPGSVNVIGNVYNQNSIVSQQGKSVQWYLDQVGGTTGDANLGEVYVVKVDGSVISQRNSANFLWYNSFWGKPLDSGDTVIVPRQYEKTAWLRDIKDIAQILGNIAMTVGVLVAAGLKF